MSARKKLVLIVGVWNLFLLGLLIIGDMWVHQRPYIENDYTLAIFVLVFVCLIVFLIYY